MRVRLLRAGVIALVVVVTMGCAERVQRSSTPPSGSECVPSASSTQADCWRMALPLGSGGFPASPGSMDRPVWSPGKFPLTLTPRLAFGDELWMTAQTLAYSSTDGFAWTAHDKTDWGERIYHSIVFFKGRLWMYGGLDYKSRNFLNDMWSSPDGLTWTNLGTAAWPARGEQTIVVYRDRLWLFGGGNHVGPDRSIDGFLNDAWVSDDGIAWTRVTDAAPWSPRADPGVMVLKGAMYLVGGQGKADVWRSPNGLDWAPLLAEAAWKPRHAYALAVLDERLWVLGGWRGASTNALNDVWSSPDGVDWSLQNDHAPWAPRAPVATVVFQDKIWIYSGKHTGFDDNWGGDLWQMTSDGHTRTNLTVTARAAAASNSWRGPAFRLDDAEPGHQ